MFAARRRPPPKSGACRTHASANEVSGDVLASTDSVSRPLQSRATPVSRLPTARTSSSPRLACYAPVITSVPGLQMHEKDVTRRRMIQPIAYVPRAAGCERLRHHFRRRIRPSLSFCRLCAAPLWPRVAALCITFQPHRLGNVQSDVSIAERRLLDDLGYAASAKPSCRPCGMPTVGPACRPSGPRGSLC